MRIRLLTFLLSLSVLLAAATSATASTGVSSPVSEAMQIGSPLVLPKSMAYVPPGFTSSAAQAVATVKRTHTLQALHRREHPLFVTPYIWEFGTPYWYITFAYRGHVVAEANVSPAGALRSVWTGPQALVPYARGNYSPTFDKWWVMAPFALVFLLPFFDLRRLRRLVHLDALVIVSFLVSYILLDHAHLQSAVWLVYPPLIYLLVRMLVLGFRASKADNRLAPLLSNRMLIVGLFLIVGARLALSLFSHQEIDVGYASVVGAHRIQHGLPLYFFDPGHGDTYGPIAYLAYLPFALLFAGGSPTTGLPSADYAAIFFDLVTIVGLFFLGRKLRTGTDGTRLGLVLAWCWSACPFTLLAVVVHTNDGLIAMLTVLGLLMFSSPVARGAMLGLAAAAKFSPAALLPLFAGPRRNLRSAIVCVATFSVVVVGAIALYLPPGGPRQFYDRTLGYQLSRPDVFSPWALHPGLHPVQTVIEILALLLVALVAFVPKNPSFPRLCALAAAVTIAVQLPAVHWFYFYIVWFMPLVLVALFARSAQPAIRRADPEPSSQPQHAETERRVPALVEAR